MPRALRTSPLGLGGKRRGLEEEVLGTPWEPEPGLRHVADPGAEPCGSPGFGREAVEEERVLERSRFGGEGVSRVFFFCQSRERNDLSFELNSRRSSGSNRTRSPRQRAPAKRPCAIVRFCRRQRDHGRRRCLLQLQRRHLNSTSMGRRCRRRFDDLLLRARKFPSEA